MSQTAVLVWLSASSVLPTFRAELDAFAQSRILRLEAPRANAVPAHPFRYAPDAVAQVESALEEAQTASAALEQARALSAVERADHLLREHPELPQSAWLMAEVLQISADIESSAPEGTGAADEFRQRALALEGPRAEPFSDRAPSAEPRALATRMIEVGGLEPDDTLEWDGMRGAPTLTTVSGEHHARVTRGDRLLWAGWLTLSATETRLSLPVPATVPCSTDDLGQSHFEGGRAFAAPHARCDSYVLARARVGGGIEAAVCEREQCGNVVHWAHRRRALETTATEHNKRLWPYAALASAGALVITGVVLWRTGAFDRPSAQTTETWVFNGQKPMGFAF